MGLFHWIFGKHPPRPPDPERAAVAGLVSTWEVPLVAEELRRAGIEATFNDDHTSYLTTGAIESRVQVHVMEPDLAATRQIMQAVRDGSPGTYSLRRAESGDRAFLEDMLHQAIFVPEGGDRPGRDVLAGPELARYVEGFGSRSGDRGWIAVDDDGVPVGAAWARRWTPPVVGYGFVDALTPELSIAVLPDHRGAGVGSALLATLLDEVGRCSLSVDRRNPAVGLYERFGFVVVERHDDTQVMLVGEEPG